MCYSGGFRRGRSCVQLCRPCVPTPAYPCIMTQSVDDHSLEQQWYILGTSSLSAPVSAFGNLSVRWAGLFASRGHVTPHRCLHLGGKSAAAGSGRGGACRRRGRHELHEGCQGGACLPSCSILHVKARSVCTIAMRHAAVAGSMGRQHEVSHRCSTQQHVLLLPSSSARGWLPHAKLTGHPLPS